MTRNTLFVILLCLCFTGFANASWTRLSLNLRRVIGSMTSAAEHLGGTYVHGITAYGKELPDGTPVYKVKFFARFGIFVFRKCRAIVYWYFRPSGLERVVTNAFCIPTNGY